MLFEDGTGCSEEASSDHDNMNGGGEDGEDGKNGEEGEDSEETGESEAEDDSGGEEEVGRG